MFQISDLVHFTGRADASKAYPVQAPLSMGKQIKGIATYTFVPIIKINVFSLMTAMNRVTQRLLCVHPSPFLTTVDALDPS